MRRGQITFADFPHRRGSDGEWRCGFCGAACPGRRTSWCSDGCVRASWVIVSPRSRLQALIAARFGTWGEARCASCNRTDAEAEQVDPTDNGQASLELDHIIELADGGCWWSTWNLQLLCRRCHKQKTSASARARAERRRCREVAA